MKFKEYRVEGKPNPINFGMSLLICSIVAILLGWLYCVVAYIPIIYFNFLIPVGFGIILAYTTQIVTKVFQIRDRKSRLIVVVIALIVGYYSHWVSFVLQIYTSEFPSLINFLNYWIFPEDFLKLIAEINTYGTWGFGFSGDSMVRGVILSLVWLFEAAIIFFVAIARVCRFPENPFSTKLNIWYPKIVLKEEFENMYSSKRFFTKIEEFGIKYILDLSRGRASKYSKISIFYLEGEDKQYLSIDTVKMPTRGDSNTEITEVVKPFEITTQEAKMLFAKFDTEKEFFLDY